MIYEKMTQEQIDALKPGDQINFPSGIATVIALVTTEGYRKDPDTILGFTIFQLGEVPGFEIERADGKRETWSKYQIGGTIATMEPIGCCSYCGKYRPPTELKKATIFVNRGTRVGTYCHDDGCAAYDQMASEG